MAVVTTHWEVRTRRGPLSTSTSPDTPQEARETYRELLAAADPDERVELVMVTETVVESGGAEGPLIDPWEAIKLPHNLIK